MYPSAPATSNLVTVAERFLGRRLRTGRCSCGSGAASGAGAGACACAGFSFFLAMDSGWPTLQLSR